MSHAEPELPEPQRVPRRRKTPPAPWFAPGLRFECTACGKCCVNHGEYGFVYSSREEREALARHFNLSREAFEARYCDEVPGGLSFKSKDDACTFLREGKCSVYELRPSQCRTFPFWPELVGDKDTWDRDVASFCPGVGQGPLHGVDEIRAAARRSGL
jgi:Fe-S-cluster containining protein